MAKEMFRWGLGLLCVMAIAGGLTASASDESTVGSFVQRLAELNGLDGSTPLGAERSLRAAGYRLPSDLDLASRLTEGRVATISRSMGLAVTTARPDSAFSNAQVDQLLGHFGPELGGGSANTTAEGTDDDGGPPPDDSNGVGPPFNPWTKGKGKGKGHVTPSEPA